MKKILLAVLIATASTMLVAQEKIKSEFNASISCSQKYGINITEGSFVLSVEYDDDKLQFNTSEGQAMTQYAVTKRTGKYVIGKESSGNYCFFDIKKNTIFYIDYFMSRYLTGGLGAGYSENKQIVLQMMEMLKEGKTQKDVVQHLIDQAEKDF